MKMVKRIMLGAICCSLLGNLSGCEFMSRADYLAKSNSEDQEQANETMQSIIDVLDEKDAEGLKAMFSKYALENTDDMESKAEDLIKFYSECCDGFEGLCDTQEISNYGKRTEILTGYYSTSDGENTYEITFTTELRNDEEPKKLGIYSIEAMIEEEELAIFGKIDIFHLSIKKNCRSL